MTAQRTYSIFFTIVLINVFMIHPLASSESPSVIQVGMFSKETSDKQLPEHWEALDFKNIERHTNYRLVEEEGSVVVKATAESSASGLIRKITVDPKEYPIVQWRWKVSNILEKGDVHKKKGDDYPARIYVTFAYDPDKLSFVNKIKYQAVKLFYGEYPPTASLNYIWASHATKGLVVPNPFTDRAMMVVVESGKEHLNTWVDEERNLYEDYKNAFKDEPPMISGVAVMTDTDNTGESATAYYGDIVFRKK